MNEKIIGGVIHVWSIVDNAWVTLDYWKCHTTTMTKMEWWASAVRELSEDTLEQVTSGIGGHVDEHGLVAGMVFDMHGMAVAELGRRSRADRPVVAIIWTSHGHYAREGVPTEGEMAVRPSLVARCGGPGMCAQCSQEASIGRSDAGKDLPRVGNPYPRV